MGQSRIDNTSMLTKLLFTVAVVIGILFFFGWKRESAGRSSFHTSSGHSSLPPRLLAKWLAMALIVVMAVGSALFFYLEWRADSEVILVRVIDARSGSISRYNAYRGDIGERSFSTLDGRHVTLAETERMETEVMAGMNR